MECPHCGNPLKDGARFCGSCGKPVDAAAAPGPHHPSVNPAAPAGPAAAEGAQRPAPVPAGGPAGGPGGPFYPPAGPSAAAAGSQQPYGIQPSGGFGFSQPGCLGAAWHDITSSPGWFKRILLLMAFNCVPFLNWYANGYCIQWGSDRAVGVQGPMPIGTFSKRAFLSGLCLTVLSIMGFFALFAVMPLTWIPFIGLPIIIVFGCFVDMFKRLAVMRMAMFDRFGEAFDLSDIVQKSRRRMGSLFASACVPGVIVGAVLCIIVIIFLVSSVNSWIVPLKMAGGNYSSDTMSWAYDHMADIHRYISDPTGYWLQLLAQFSIWITVLSLLFSFFIGFAQAWSFRALGHWIERYAPEWKAQARQGKPDEPTAQR